MPSSHALDISPFQDSIKNYCKREPSASLVTQCFVDAGKKMRAFQEFISRGDTDGVLKFCADASKGDGDFVYYSLLKCAVSVSKKKSSHPFPRWVGVELVIEKFRSEWVSLCFAKLGPEVNTCVQKQQQGFFAFLSEYESLKEGDDVLFGKISRCVNTANLKRTDFSNYLRCRSVY